MLPPRLGDKTWPAVVLGDLYGARVEWPGRQPNGSSRTPRTVARDLRGVRP